MSNKHIAALTFLLVANILVMAVTYRSIPVGCALCKEVHERVSPLDYASGYYNDIPLCHSACAIHVAETLAPNCNMTVGQWFEIRGYSPRLSEHKGETIDQLYSRLGN